jgi:nucleoside 2-deoxyribosyltransferase
VFQPFDKGPYDKRFDDTIAPAIAAAGLEPYRVDRDDGAVIPIETLHEEIRSATLCLADIGARNPNVMYELGYAIASAKDVVIICSNQSSDKYPFDIQHRGIIQYASDSASDFDKLKNDITNRITTLLKKQVTTESIAAASPVKMTEGLRPHEIASLAFVMTNSTTGGDGAAGYSIRNDMEKAGYTSAAAQLGLLRLTRCGFIEAYEDNDYNDNRFTAYRLTSQGADWLLDNQDKLQIRVSDDPPRQSELTLTDGITDDDVPF